MSIGEIQECCGLISLRNLMTLFDKRGTHSVFIPFDEKKVSPEQVLEGFAYYFQDFRFKPDWEYCLTHSAESVNEYLGKRVFSESDKVLNINVKNYMKENRSRFVSILRKIGLSTVSKLLNGRI